MNILAVDISGKVHKYDRALYEKVHLALRPDRSFTFVCPYFTISNMDKPLRLVSFIPERFRHSLHIVKRLTKVLEGIVNYQRVLRYVRKNHVDVLHLQWLPFMEFCSVEKHWLQRLHHFNPALRIVLTIHNIYPHNSSEAKQKTYNRRMRTIIPLFDHFIVHNNTSKQAVMREFGIPSAQLSVVPHGVFIPVSLPQRTRTDDKLRVVLFGRQTDYKGTDVLVHAAQILPADIQSKLDIHIIGYTDNRLYEQWAAKAEQLHISWENRFVSDEDLYQALQNADLIVYPYRDIAQSGALLLGLYFAKPVIVSDLPAFREILGNAYPSQLIVEPGNAQGLADALKWYTDHAQTCASLRETLQDIAHHNSWEQAAIETIEVYNAL